MIKDVAEAMHTFFVPQMQQLDLHELDARHGSLSTLNADVGTGTLWAFSLSEDCLYTYNDVHLQSDVSFVEFPEDSICISYMSRDSARQIPADLLRRRAWSEHNLLSFRMRDRPISCRMLRGEHCRSHSLVMLPSFFDRLEGLTDEERQQLFDFLSAASGASLPPKLASLFSELVPALSRRPGGNMHCVANVSEILASVMDAAFMEAQSEEVPDAKDSSLAQEAKRVIDERFAEKLTVSALAGELFVGRTRLCEAFRRELGVGIGEYLRERRMEEAALLLANTTWTVSRIARSVGYGHASSFCEAFRRHFGLSPERYRRLR